MSLKILLENLLRFEDGNTVRKEDIKALGNWAVTPPPAEEIAYRPGAGADAGLHRRARRRRSGGDAQRGRRRGLRPEQHQSAVAGGSRHRPLGDGRQVRHQQSVRRKRRHRDGAQPRTLSVPALGADGVRQLPRGAARHRHLPSGESGIPREGRLDEDRERPNGRVSRHAGRHRQPHDDDQRPRRARLGRRRHRGRGRDARPTDLDVDSRTSSAFD